MLKPSVAMYSGLTSQSINKSKEMRKTVNTENVQKKAHLRPSAQIVFDEIDKLKEEALDLKSFVLEGQSDDDVKLELAIRKRTYFNLVKLQTRFNTILKSEPKEYLDDKKL
jgi:hypothetical protein